MLDVSFLSATSFFSQLIDNQDWHFLQGPLISWAECVNSFETSVLSFDFLKMSVQAYKTLRSAQ
jgi:hypothetical protein